MGKVKKTEMVRLTEWTHVCGLRGLRIQLAPPYRVCPACGKQRGRTDWVH